MPRNDAALAPAPSAIDGRFARAERTREAVVEALLSLIEEGDLRPSAARIADRADVSLRTVFHHYDDMESLVASAAERQLRHLLAIIRPVPRSGPLDARISAFVTGRSRLLEAISPVRRAALLTEPFSQELHTRLTWARRRARTEIERVFAEELAAIPAAGRRDVLEALTAATSWPAWESLRAHQLCSIAQARRAMTRTITALLEEKAP
jgi:TetR/AcrR family transcriptional regulator, regulator of autoinduction and epiphytic fitness